MGSFSNYLKVVALRVEPTTASNDHDGIPILGNLREIPLGTAILGRNSAVPLQLHLYATFKSLYDTFSTPPSSIQRSNFVMEFMPIAFSEEHQLWARESISRFREALDTALATSQGEGAGVRMELDEPHDDQSLATDFRWQEPDDLLAALLLSDLVLQLEHLREQLGHDAKSKRIAQIAIASLGHWLAELVRSTGVTYDEETERLVQLIAAEKASRLYVQIRGLGLAKCEGLLLQTLLSSKVPSAVRVGVDLIVEQPPKEWSESSQAIGALIQSHHWKLRDVFPRLLDSTVPAVLAPALDLANLQVRKYGVQPHPAAERLEPLLSLTGGVTQQLASMEEDPSKFSNTVAGVQRILFDSVSLLVALCDYLGLMGDARAIGKLTQALDLKHRRIKAEAAFALAKLGEERARDLLLEMVTDDASRLRALAYATELGLEDRIDPQWLSSLSKARSELSLWLSQPEQFSIPPHAMELVEQRTMRWPGFDGPQECFLIRFEYQFGDEKFENIGFAGPFTATVSFHLLPLSPDQCWEVYLANDVEDESERRWAWSNLPGRDRGWAESCIERLEENGFESMQPKGAFEFLGSRALFCEGLDHQSHVVHSLCDGASVYSTKPMPGSADFLYLQWKGQICMEHIEDV